MQHECGLLVRQPRGAVRRRLERRDRQPELNSVHHKVLDSLATHRRRSIANRCEHIRVAPASSGTRTGPQHCGCLCTQDEAHGTYRLPVGSKDSESGVVALLVFDGALTPAKVPYSPRSCVQSSFGHAPSAATGAEIIFKDVDRLQKAVPSEGNTILANAEATGRSNCMTV